MAEILLYGIIGEPADGLDSKTVVTAIRAAKGNLDVRINSPGGFVMEGLTIIEALRTYSGGKVTTYVDGLAASMASVILMAGAERVMASSALLMVHDPMCSVFGNATELRSQAASLDRIKTQIVNTYAAGTGLDPVALDQMLADETWLDPQQALALGFITTISEPLRIAAIADVSAYGFHHVPDRLKDITMPEALSAVDQAVATERTRVSTIQSLATKHNLPPAMASTMIEKGTALDVARGAMLDYLADRSDAQNIGHRFSGGEDTLANPSFHAKAIGDAIYSRLSGKAPEGAAREFASASIVDMAREMLHRRGVREAIRMRPDDVLHPRNWTSGTPSYRGEITTTTSDFPDLLQASGHRFLMEKYAAAASVIKMVARQRTAVDFRSITGVQLGGFGTLETVNEAGEFKNGSFQSRSETYKLAPFGKMFNLSRQALVNDDLGAFSDVLMIMGRAAAETEAVALAALLTSNPNMADGNAVFSTPHGNLSATSDVPTPATFGAARQAMRNQLDLDGKTPLNIVPRYILAGPAQEFIVELALSPVQAAAVANANPFVGKLMPLIDPRLSGKAWYLFGDPATGLPPLEYAYLNGQDGPFLDSELGWRVDGTEYKVRHDFGCGWIDWKGAYKNPGA